MSYVPVPPRTNLFLKQVILLSVEPLGIEIGHSQIKIGKYLYHGP
ncbi:hypothetical protein F383_26789 [Gossypium arboreum]|uniref:Uncharacterized protein n=1 Tax=Gossypium arboreum TaxID=29729 RepID=A0A0B0PC18_GOSAR|nr:hypothetical protein F383_26789 [Gossypium arboreum]